MRKWTQAELDAEKPDLTGILNLGTGDFRGCLFYGRHRVHIGPDSLLGDGVHLGENCKIGEGSQIGERFMSGDFCEIGERCHFGVGAHIGFGSKIGAGSCLATGCTILRETILCEGVRLPDDCELFGVKGVRGKSMLRVGPIVGRHVMAFIAEDEEGKKKVYAGCTGVEVRELEAFKAYVEKRMQRPGSDVTWAGMALAAGYISGHFALYL